MKILWITLESILPANSGGRMGVFKRIEQLSKTEDIYLFYPYDSYNELNYVNEIKKYCKEVHPYSRKANRNKAILNLFRYPYTISTRNIKEMQKDINKCIKENNIDVINVDFPHMCVNLKNNDIKNIPIILNEHNIEWKVYQLISNSQKNILKKIIYYIDSFRLRKFERKILKKIDFDKITFVSSSDLDFFAKDYNMTKSKLELIPVGADIRENKHKEESKQKNIIFVGKMSYGPNIEAVNWFVNNVFYKIKKEYNDVKFYIVGKDPTQEILKLSNNDIIVTGKVDSVEEYYNLADLVVIPLLNGGGVKVKLLEAISFNKKIVSTTKGVEGTIYSNLKTIPVSDSCIEFSNLCIKSLMEDDEILERREEAYKLFIENYTWNSIGKKYKRIIEKVVEKDERK